MPLGDRGGRKNPVFCGFFCTKELMEEFDKLAKQQDRSRSTYIRRLVRKELERVNGK